MGGQVFAFSFAKKPHYCAKSSLTNGKKKATLEELKAILEEAILVDNEPQPSDQNTNSFQNVIKVCKYTSKNDTIQALFFIILNIDPDAVLSSR